MESSAMQGYTRIAMTAAALSSLALAAAYAGAQERAGTQAGSYRLATFAGRALPTLIEEEDGCREEVLSATLTLEAGGRWVLVSRERETCGTAVEEDEDSETGSYSVTGGTLRFNEVDGDGDDGDDDVDLD